MDSNQQPDFGLLQLPDPCLLVVLGYCKDDPRSLFSAARAHSRLHQAAAVAASSFRAVLSKGQEDSVLRYLISHGQHIDSINIEGKQGLGALRQRVPTVQQLPYVKLQGLTSMRFSKMHLHLQPGDMSLGVLGAGLPVKRLQLDYCTVLDGEQGLAAALALLPALQHFRLVWPWDLARGDYAGFPGSALTSAQQLTCLELAPGPFRIDSGATYVLQDLAWLQGLTRLQHLWLAGLAQFTIPTSLLSGLHQLSYLNLHGLCGKFEPGFLVGMTQLRHLELEMQSTAGAEQLLFHLKSLLQLTYLDLQGVLHSQVPTAPAAAYSALTASSTLQHLDLSYCTLPAGVWQNLFPAGRLPHLTALYISHVSHPQLRVMAAALGGNLLVSCCPGLQVLNMAGLGCKAELLNPLQRLSSLHELVLGPAGSNSAAVLGEVCQLTGLRRLEVHDQDPCNGLLMLGLTQLAQLTALTLITETLWNIGSLKWSCQAPGDEPVWRQVLQHYLSHSNPDVAQQAAAAYEQLQL